MRRESSGSKPKVEQLFLDEVRRVDSAATRLLHAANEGNKCAMLVECHTLLGQVRSLAEALESKLKAEGRYCNGR